MQGVVFDIKRFAIHDGPGIRTTVFLKGCPLKCYWCHNPEGITSEPFQSDKTTTLNNKSFCEQETVGKFYTVEQILEIVKKDRIFMEESGGGVTLSGGEPALQSTFSFELLKAFRCEGFHTAVDTSGFMSQETLNSFIPLTNLFLYDIKHIDCEKHIRYTGVGNQVIINNLTWLLINNIPLRIRIPVIPGFNFSKPDMSDIITFLRKHTAKSIKIDLLPYHSIATHKYMRFKLENKMERISSLRHEDLKEIFNQFEAAGFSVTIGG